MAKLSWLPVILAVVLVPHPVSADALPQGSETSAAQSTTRRSGSWLIEETANFSICRPVGYKLNPETVRSIEALRSTLCDKWLPKSEKAAWNPKCQIVVHARLEGYIKEVGPGGRQTTGSSLIDFDKDVVVMRRIDIRGDRADWLVEALAHELTHVVLADRFAHVAIPHWADEGMAIQADTAKKRQLHGHDLSSAVAGGREFRLAELLTMENYPAPSRMGTFYGQSASLVEFLTTIGTREQLVDFVDQATARGYDVALRKVYTIASVGALEGQWRQHMRGDRTRKAKVSAVRAVAPASDVAANRSDPAEASTAGDME